MNRRTFLTGVMVMVALPFEASNGVICAIKPWKRTGPAMITQFNIELAINATAYDM